MKKLWQKIIIGIIILGVFLLPISAGINNKFAVRVEINEAGAVVNWWYSWTVTKDTYTPGGSFKDVKTHISDIYPDNPNGCEAARSAFATSQTSNTSIKVDTSCSNGTPPSTDTITTQTSSPTTDQNPADIPFGCTFAYPTTWPNCIVWIVYTLIFQPIAAFARLTAHILDFFIYYSTNSDSYAHDFVQKGWGAIRDVANIFFIVALLYVGLKTILGMNVSNNKRLVGTIILVALVINFSLFTTKVVIDASNVLAKIFYNNITPVGSNGQDISNDEGEKSISLGLVKEFNPQNIFAENNFSIKKNIGTFAFLLFLSIIMMGYMIYIFLSVALLFLARVVTLWISMIFSPIAFASLTIEANMGGLGFKKWWTELLKVAFMAPIFIFFLYIIILFGDLMSIVKYGNTNTVIEVNDFQTYMGILIPFMIIFALLMKAKKLAVEYSGEMGEMVTKAGTAVAGLAIGAATGGTAMLASGTIGKYASKVANNDELKKKAAAGDRGAQRKLALANSVASKSFDFRQTGAGKIFQSKTGLNLSQGTGVIGLGEDKLKGGNKARDVRILEKEEEKLKTYQLSKAEAEKQTKKANDEKEPQNIRAAQYEKDGKKNLKKYGLDKTVEGGSVKKILNAEQTNKERRDAYANSSDNEVRGKEGVSKNTKVRKYISRFYDNWKEGFGETLATPTGLGATAVAGIATGGIGLALVPVFGGFLKAFTEQMKKGNRSTNMELVAGIRKGMDKKEKALKDIAAAFGGDLNLVAAATKVAAKKEPVVHIKTPETPPGTEHETEGDGHTK